MNPADICRECELRQRVKELERNNSTLTNLLVELISHKIDIIKHPEEELKCEKQ